MIDSDGGSDGAETAEGTLRRLLVQGDVVAGTVAPVLRHLLVNTDAALFGDDILARVRGMAADVAAQLLGRLSAAAGNKDRPDHDPAAIAQLTDAFFASPPFLGHLHALALEWQLTERMQARLALDPVLSPLLQAQVASPDGEAAALAMNVLAAQARFCQAQRRMQLPLAELPGDLLHGALIALRTLGDPQSRNEEAAIGAEAAVRAAYDEGRSRVGLIARLVTGLGAEAGGALSVGQAGVAIFLSALAFGSGQDRDRAALSTSESQLARLALGLRASGLEPQAVTGELLALHDAIDLPDGFAEIGADRAAAMLVASGGSGA